MAKKIAMIPARLGSQRLAKKNLQLFGGFTLIEHAIKRCQAADIFDEIYVNSESLVFKEYAQRNKVFFYHRPSKLGDNESTSEEFVEDFITNVGCENLYQIHSITPLFSSEEIRKFVLYCENNSELDTILTCIHDQIEVAHKNQPINFSYSKKSNSQDLLPMQRITWAATKWSSSTYLEAKRNGSLGTYSGEIGYYQVNTEAGLAIKTAKDLAIANALNNLSL